MRRANCTVQCADSVHYEPVIEHLITNERGRRLQLLQSVTNITCEPATGHWQPDTSQLVCVKRCTHEFIGDGWCDLTNNRAHCRWDGGDCCASTVPNGEKVRAARKN
jgi:hypothetical protein